MPDNQDTPAGVINAMAQQHQQQHSQQQMHQQQGVAPPQQGQQPTTSATSPTVAAAQAAQAAATAAAAVGVQPGQNNNIVGNDDNLACQWQGCLEVCASPEALYEHVCERHVGRKSTNNLNLTCNWGGCRTTVVKRDHITSHIRVHVPLKPHKCDFCGKSFKRPQDLKKHVKTHADDSVLVKSPDPQGAPRQPNVMYGVPGAKNHYFESSMNQVAGQPYGHGGPQYYQAAQHQPQSNQSYGNVYYTLSHGNDGNRQSASLETQKRDREIFEDFVGVMKRQQFDPTSYPAVSQRLMGLHGLQLPLATSDSIPEYHHAPAMVGVGGPGGYQTASMPPQMYQLPPVNLRTKADLMNIDRFLEQMQSTVYEGNEEAAAGVGQPGAHFVHGGVTYSSNNSPPTAASHLPSSHATATTSAPVAAATPSAHSPHSSTPALTPPSSAQSYTSARSPSSFSSAHQRSPLLNQQNPLTSAGMYPTLPAPNAQDTFPTGYPVSSSSAAPASTLGNAFDNDDRRRYTGGMLQRSRPAETRTEDMNTSVSNDRDNSRTTPTKDDPRRRTPEGAVPFSANLVDPALRNYASPYPPVESPPEKKDSPRETKSATASPGSTSQDDSLWVENIRIIEGLRRYVSERLEHGIYEAEGADEQSQAEEQKSGSMDVDMGGTEARRGPSESRAASPSHEADAGESLYPILKALESDDGDVKMGSNEASGT